MKSTISIVMLGLSLICAGSIYAGSFAECDYYLSIEALYWKPMHCPIFVARRSNNPGNNVDLDDVSLNQLFLTGEYDPGVRARLGYQGCEWFSDISYLYFQSCDKVSQSLDSYLRQLIAGAPPFSGNDVMDFVKASADFRYQNLNGCLGHYFCQQCNFNPFVYVNARWVKIDFKNFIQAIPEGETTFTDFLKQDSYFNGGGLGFGLGGAYSFCEDFCLAANTGITAIIGETKLKNYSSRTINSNVHPGAHLDKSEHWCHILPALDFKISLDYSWCWCVDWKVEVGYELDYYFHALRYASSNLVSGSSGRIPLFTCEDVGFAGPYFSLAVSF